MLVRMKTTWAANADPTLRRTFRRSVFDAAGNRLRTLEFQQGDVVELTDADDIAAIAKDVGANLPLEELELVPGMVPRVVR